MDAPAACHIAANVGPAERILSPFMSAGVRTQLFFDATAPASHESDSTMTPAFSICALMSFMNGESLSRAARS